MTHLIAFLTFWCLSLGVNISNNNDRLRLHTQARKTSLK